MVMAVIRSRYGDIEADDDSDRTNCRKNKEKNECSHGNSQK